MQPHPGNQAAAWDPCGSVSAVSHPGLVRPWVSHTLLCYAQMTSLPLHGTCVRRSQDAVPLIEHVSLTAYSAHTMHMGPEDQIMLMPWVGKSIQRSPRRDGERSVNKLLLGWNHGWKRSGRSVPQKGPSEESWLRDRCLTVKGLQSNAQACISSGLLPQTPPFRQETTMNWPQLPRRPGLLH